MKYLYIFTISLFVFLSSCGVKEASVSGNPPELEKVVFKAGALAGQFESTEAPKVFLWPTTGENGKALNRKEQILKRTEIFRKAEVQSLTEKSVKEKVGKIIGETQKSIEKLVATFVQSKCGSLADDVFGDPDPNSTTVEEWKEPENEEERLKIADCQANLDEREAGLLEAEQKTTPLKEKALEATVSLLRAIGSDNFFNDVSGLSLNFESPNNIDLKNFKEIDFSSESEDPNFKISDIAIDAGEGLVSFSVPAFSKEVGSSIIGKYVFDFEISLGGEKTKLDGEIRLILLDGTVRTGRATFEGLLR